MDAQNREKIKPLVQDLANYLGGQYTWIDKLITHESGYKRNIENSIGAVGYIQFLPSTLDNLGFNAWEFKLLTDKEQFNVIKKFYSPIKGRVRTIFDIFIYNFWPAAIIYGYSDNKVYQTANISAHTIASQNKPFDINKNGEITLREVKQYIAKKYKIQQSNGLLWLLLGGFLLKKSKII